jgi:hypothetical protein
MPTILNNPLRRGNFTGMKSHEWIIMLGPVGVYYYECLGVEQEYKTAFQSLFWWLYELRAPRLSRKRIEGNMYSWEKWGIESMALIEPLMPDDFMTINFHLLSHLPHIIQKYGPIKDHYMMKEERMHHIMKSMLHAHKAVEETLMRAVIEFEHVSWDSHPDYDEIDMVIHSTYPDISAPVQVTLVEKPIRAPDLPDANNFIKLEYKQWKRENRRTEEQRNNRQQHVDNENNRRKKIAKDGAKEWNHIHVFFMNHGNTLIGQVHDVFKKLYPDLWTVTNRYVLL